jgi:anti-sigma regulatory factor (Ser/Thr protein kinase)
LDLSDIPPTALPRVRRWITGVLTSLGQAHQCDVLMVAEELLENAYDHGQGPRLIRLIRHHGPCRVDVEVEDAGGQTTLVVGPARSPRGRGLLMVAQAAQDWGMRGDSAGGKTVWAAIGCQDTDPCPEPVARPADDVLDRPPPADKPEPTEQT